MSATTARSLSPRGGRIACAAALVGLAFCSAGCGPAAPPSKAEIETRIREQGSFRSVTLAGPEGEAYAGQAVDADGLAYDLSVAVQPGVVTYKAESRETDARWERLEKAPAKHLGLRDVVWTKTGDGQFEGTGVSGDGVRCDFSLKRQAAPPFPGGVAYDFRVRDPGGEERTGVIQMNLDPALPLIGAKYGGFRSFRPVRLG
jgi:hypothetical protein